MLGSSPVLAGLLGWAVGHPPGAAWAVATAVCLAGLGLQGASLTRQERLTPEPTAPV